MQPRYHPFYCEENIWWLCAREGGQAASSEPSRPHQPRSEQSGAETVTGTEGAAGLTHAIFVASTGGAVPVAAQRAGGERGVVWWDYHCIGLDAGGRIWDLDSSLPLPVAAAEWLVGSFPRVAGLPESLRPRFRLVPAATFVADFASDRGHMRTEDGGWLHAPPPWPCIGSGSNLAAHRNVTDPEGPGQLYDFAEFGALLQAGAEAADLG